MSFPECKQKKNYCDLKCNQPQKGKLSQLWSAFQKLRKIKNIRKNIQKISNKEEKLFYERKKHLPDWVSYLGKYYVIPEQLLAILPSAFGQNRQTPYGICYVEEWAGNRTKQKIKLLSNSFTSRGEKLMYQEFGSLGAMIQERNEVLVVVADMPNAAIYWSFAPYHFDRFLTKPVVLSVKENKNIESTSGNIPFCLRTEMLFFALLDNPVNNIHIWGELVQKFGIGQVIPPSLGNMPNEAKSSSSSTTTTKTELTSPIELKIRKTNISTNANGNGSSSSQYTRVVMVITSSEYLANKALHDLQFLFPVHPNFPTIYKKIRLPTHTLTSTETGDIYNPESDRYLFLSRITSIVNPSDVTVFGLQGNYSSSTLYPLYSYQPPPLPVHVLTSESSFEIIFRSIQESLMSRIIQRKKSIGIESKDIPVMSFFDYSEQMSMSKSKSQSYGGYPGGATCILNQRNCFGDNSDAFYKLSLPTCLNYNEILCVVGLNHARYGNTCYNNLNIYDFIRAYSFAEIHATQKDMIDFFILFISRAILSNSIVQQFITEIKRELESTHHPYQFQTHWIPVPTGTPESFQIPYCNTISVAERAYLNTQFTKNASEGGQIQPIRKITRKEDVAGIEQITRPPENELQSIRVFKFIFPSSEIQLPL